MDTVRLGRALGAGTRQLAKTAAEVTRAINAPPATGLAATRATGPAATRGTATPSTPRDTATSSAATPVQPRSRSNAVPAAGPRASRRAPVLAPLRRFGGTLWLQVTGTFFALLALTLLAAAWKVHPALHATGTVEQRHLWLYFGFGSLFLYFAVSSFIKAERR